MDRELITGGMDSQILAPRYSEKLYLNLDSERIHNTHQASTFRTTSITRRRRNVTRIRSMQAEEEHHATTTMLRTSTRGNTGHNNNNIHIKIMSTSTR